MYSLFKPFNNNRYLVMFHELILLLIKNITFKFEKYDIVKITCCINIFSSKNYHTNRQTPRKMYSREKIETKKPMDILNENDKEKLSRCIIYAGTHLVGNVRFTTTITIRLREKTTWNRPTRNDHVRRYVYEFALQVTFQKPQWLGFIKNEFSDILVRKTSISIFKKVFALNFHVFIRSLCSRRGNKKQGDFRLNNLRRSILSGIFVGKRRCFH